MGNGEWSICRHGAWVMVKNAFPLPNAQFALIMGNFYEDKERAPFMANPT